ncbi:rhomboid family intramembrane serine protease [Andreprevotia chitinilytica]|uniref:rhomboid family intramembrane serine protease n=1 Tax=Andreprevotia chitinilytica TaxID=396808 RepID=UPI00068B11C1|nr:rhomboid family intramembrane serine protease [Andreprevotia chitinilytica]
MLILPLPAKPDWRRPPWVTLLLIAVCCIIYFGLQFDDDARRVSAFEFYHEAGLDKLELPLYLKYLEKTGQHDLATELNKDFATTWPRAVMALQADRDFRHQLTAGQVIAPDSLTYDKWHADRSHFEALYKQIFTERFALRPAAPEPVGVFMHMFMHGSVDHLLGNMAILFIVGYTVEMALGAGLFLAFYLLSGLGAAIPDLLGTSPPYMLSLGASGAIAGVMAMFVVLYGTRKIRFFYWVLVYFSTITAPALLVLPIWLLKEALMRTLEPKDHVNYMAHFAGLLTGAALVAVYRWQRGWQSADKVVQDDQAQRDDVQRKQAAQWLSKLEFERAARAYAALTDARSNDVELVGDFYRAAKLQPDAALRFKAASRVIALTADGRTALLPDSADAWLWILKQRQPMPKLSLPQWLRLAACWLDGGHATSCEPLLQMLVKRAADQPALPALLYRTGLVFREQGETTRAKACWRLLIQHYPRAEEVKWAMADAAFKA